MANMTDDAKAFDFREQMRAMVKAGDTARLELEIAAFSNPKLTPRQCWLEVLMSTVRLSRGDVMTWVLDQNKIQLTPGELNVALRCAASAGECFAMEYMHWCGADAFWVPQVADIAQVPANLVGLAGSGGHVSAVKLALFWGLPVQVDDLRRIALGGWLDVLVTVRERRDLTFPPDLHLAAAAGYALWEPGYRGQLSVRGQKFAETVAYTLEHGGDPWLADGQQQTGLTIAERIKDARLKDLYLRAMAL